MANEGQLLMYGKQGRLTVADEGHLSKAAPRVIVWCEWSSGAQLDMSMYGLAVSD